MGKEEGVYLVGLGGLRHKSSSVEVDEQARGRREVLGLQSQWQGHGAPFRAGEGQQRLAVLER